ncbi:hypothetical protein ACFE04_013831 [Oxalis oulophora]
MTQTPNSIYDFTVKIGLSSSSRACETRYRGLEYPVTFHAAKSGNLGMRGVDIRENEVSLSEYRGKVLLIVNVASKCGLTQSNYKELNVLYEKYKGKGFEILAFPCNQFGGQEPGGKEEIQEVACTLFKAEFPIFDKVEVNGKNAAPLFKFLKSEKGGYFGDAIKWNFTKFLVNKEGKVVQRYAPTTSPLKIEVVKMRFLESDRLRKLELCLCVYELRYNLFTRRSSDRNGDGLEATDERRHGDNGGPKNLNTRVFVYVQRWSGHQWFTILCHNCDYQLRGKMTPHEEKLVVELHAKWGNSRDAAARAMQGWHAQLSNLISRLVMMLLCLMLLGNMSCQAEWNGAGAHNNYRVYKYGNSIVVENIDSTS